MLSPLSYTFFCLNWDMQPLENASIIYDSRGQRHSKWTWWALIDYTWLPNQNKGGWSTKPMAFFWVKVTCNSSARLWSAEGILLTLRWRAGWYPFIRKPTEKHLSCCKSADSLSFYSTGEMEPQCQSNGILLFSKWTKLSLLCAKKSALSNALHRSYYGENITAHKSKAHKAQRQWWSCRIMASCVFTGAFTHYFDPKLIICWGEHPSSKADICGLVTGSFMKSRGSIDSTEKNAWKVRIPAGTTTSTKLEKI